MRSQEMTKKQLKRELEELRQRNAELEKLEYDHKRAEAALKNANEEMEQQIEERTAELSRANELLNQEIEKRKRTQEELYKEKYRIIAEKAPMGLSIIGKDGSYKYIKPKFVEIFGYTLQDISTGREWFAKAYPDDEYRDQAMSSWVTELKGEKPGEFRPRTFTVTCKNGVAKSIHFRPVAMSSGDHFIIYEDITERKRAEEKLRIYQEQLRSLASELLLTEERERRRLASDIHDSISQNLAISKIELDELRRSTSSSSLERHLKKISGLINQTIQQIRSMIFELSPPILYGIGLEAAIEYLAERMEKQFGIHIHFTDDKQSKELNEDLRVLVFRAVQELLFNVVKHARTQKVRVSIARNCNDIKICVEDDGIGFDIAEIDPCLDRAGRFGLFSIKERLQHLDGRFEIVSKPGQGTQVTLIVPLEQHTRTATS
jgi:PAS domain S-box-containing protein